MMALFSGSCFAINQSFLNSHPSYRFMCTESVKGVSYDFYMDTKGKWVTSPEKDAKVIQVPMIAAKTGSSQTSGTSSMWIMFKNGEPIKAKMTSSGTYEAIKPDVRASNILQELYKQTSNTSTTTTPKATATNTAANTTTRQTQSTQDRIFRHMMGFLGLFIIVAIGGFLYALAKKGVTKAKKKAVTVKNNLSNNVIPTIKDRANSSRYWHDLELLFKTMNPDMQRMTIYIEMPRVCKSWFIGKENISNHEDALQNCHKCARYMDQFSIEEMDKSNYEEDTLELYAEALALVGVSYFQLDDKEDVEYYCARALKFLSKQMENYNERAEVCNSIIEECNK
jgi:hypothetical protein